MHRILNETESGQTDLERKFSADEREPYKGTVSEETEIEQKNSIKMEKTTGFQPKIFSKFGFYNGRGVKLCTSTVFCSVAPKCDNPGANGFRAKIFG